MNTIQDLSIFKHSFPQETVFEVLGRFLVGVYISIVAAWIIYLAKFILSQWTLFLLLLWHGWSVKHAVLMTILRMLDQKPDFSDILPRKESSRHDLKTKAVSQTDSARNKVHCKDQKANSFLEKHRLNHMATHRLHNSKKPNLFEVSQTATNKTLKKPTLLVQKATQEETNKDSIEDLLRQLEALEKQKEPTMSEIDDMYYQGIIPPSWTSKLNIDCDHQLAPTHEKHSFDRMSLLTVQGPTYATNHPDQRQVVSFINPSASFGLKKSYTCREDQASNNTSTCVVVGSNDTLQKQVQKMSLKGLEAKTIQTTASFQGPFTHQQPISPFQKSRVSIPSRCRKSTRFTLPSKKQRAQHLEQVKKSMKAGLDERASIPSSDNTKYTNITLRSGNITENLSINSIKQILAEKVFDHDQEKVNVVCKALEASLTRKNKNATIQESSGPSTKVNEKPDIASEESFVSSLPDSDPTILDKEAN